MPARKIQNQTKNKTPRQMAEGTKQLRFRDKVINKEGTGELHPFHRGPLDKPLLAQPTAAPPELVDNAAAWWDGFASLMLLSFCAWLRAPVTSPRPALAFTDLVSPAVIVKD